ncbi:MAG: hypothetical protein AB7P04_10195 [Bacteriovoracia bacterium]
MEVTRPAAGGGQPQAPGSAEPAPAPAPEPPKAEPTAAEKCDQRRQFLKDEFLGTVDVQAAGESLYRFVESLDGKMRRDFKNFHEAATAPNVSVGDALIARTKFNGAALRAFGRLERLHERDSRRDHFALVDISHEGFFLTQRYLVNDMRMALIASDTRSRVEPTRLDRTRLLWLPSQPKFARVTWMASTIRANERLEELTYRPNLALDRGEEQSLWKVVEAQVDTGCKGLTALTLDEIEKFDWVEISRFKPAPAEQPTE